MSLVASQITSLTIVYSTVYSGADQRKHQTSASLAFVRGIHRGPVNSPHKWPVTRKMFPSDDVMISSDAANIICGNDLPVPVSLNSSDGVIDVWLMQTGVGHSHKLLLRTHWSQWLGALMFSLTCAWTNCWVNNRDSGELRRHRAHYDVTVMMKKQIHDNKVKCVFHGYCWSHNGLDFIH